MNGIVTARAQQAQDTRQRLIEAAGQLFAKRGYAESSVAAIGEAAGVSRGLVNFHFGSKEKLLWAVVESFVGEFEREIFEPTVAGRSGFEAVHGVLEAHRRLLTERPERARLLYRLLFEALDDRRGLAQHFGGMHARWQQRTYPWWKEAVDAGQVDPTLDHAAITSFMLSALRGIALDWLIAPESFDLDAAYAQLWRSFTRGIVP